MKLRDFTKLFFAFVFLHLAVLYKQDTGLLYYISKPLLLLSLIAFFASKTKGDTPLRRFVLAAFIFSLIGDILLMKSGDFFFLSGMGAFALAQISYAAFFIKRARGPMEKKSFFISLPLILGGFYFLNSWIDLPADLQVPVNVYAFLLSLNLAAGINFNFRNNLPYYTVTLGLIMFLISDLLLAYNLFNESSIWQQIGVMLFYSLAQFLLMWGILLGYNSLSVEVES